MARAAIDHRSFEVQLAAMSEEAIRDVTSRLDAAADAGLAAFDRYAKNMVTSRPTLKRFIRKNSDACSITYVASLRWPKIETIQVTPSLAQDTTGRNRQPITVTGWVGRPVTIPMGFIWQGRLWRRDPSRAGRAYGYYTDSRGYDKDPIVYVSGRYLWELDGLPRPADVLTRCAGDVIAATEEVLNAGRQTAA